MSASRSSFAASERLARAALSARMLAKNWSDGPGLSQADFLPWLCSLPMAGRCWPLSSGRQSMSVDSLRQNGVLFYQV